jgi:hypothetical protein
MIRHTLVQVLFGVGTALADDGVAVFSAKVPNDATGGCPGHGTSGPQVDVPQAVEACTMNVDLSRGTWTFHRDSVPTLQLRERLVDADVIRAAEQSVADYLARQLGGKSPDIGVPYSTTILAETSEEPGVKYVIGSQVWIPRVIEGLPVEGHRISAFVDLTGDVVDIVARWPKVVVAAADAERARDESGAPCECRPAFGDAVLVTDSSGGHLAWSPTLGVSQGGDITLKLVCLHFVAAPVSYFDLGSGADRGRVHATEVRCDYP